MTSDNLTGPAGGESPPPAGGTGQLPRPPQAMPPRSWPPDGSAKRGGGGRFWLSVTFVSVVFTSVALLALYVWQMDNFTRLFGPRAKVQTSASRLAADVPGADDDGPEAKAAKREWEGKDVEVAGVVVGIVSRDSRVRISLGDRDGGPELVRCECLDQGPAEVGYHAVVRGRVSGYRGNRPVPLSNGFVVKASR